MFAKTLCRPGAYVEVVPVGLLATLEYNENGLLYSIHPSMETDNEVYGKPAFDHLKQFVPHTVPITGGTTWVQGVFYTSAIPQTEGPLPQCIENELLEDNDLTFYAGRVDSLGAAFRGPRVIRNWLSMAGFNLLPGAIVPVEFSKFSIDMMMSTGSYDFVYPFIAGYFIYESLDYRFEFEHLNQIVVKSINRGISSEGYFRAEITSDTMTLFIDVSDIILENIRVGSILLVDGDTIVAVDSNSDEVYEQFVVCPDCGKSIPISSTGPVQCSDINCVSRMYPDIQKLLATFELPEISYETFRKHVKDKTITCLTDVLALPEYKTSEHMTASLEQILSACVPVSICSNVQVFNKFVASCNNKVSTFIYYIKNPSKIYTELLSTGSDSIMVRRLVEWLSDPFNASTVLTVLSIFTITEPKQRFEGAPIFRNRSLMLTGKFKRGSIEDVESILKSYSAKIVKPGEPMICDCVIVGSLHDSVDGAVIQEANLRGVTVVDEDDFFLAYDLDKDIASNLL